MLRAKRKKEYQPNRLYQWRRVRAIGTLSREFPKRIETRASKAALKNAIRIMKRNMRLKKMLRDYFGWGKATFARSLRKLASGSVRLPRKKSYRLPSDT